MTDSPLLFKMVEEGIAQATLNRPDKRNALNIPLMREFCHQIESVKDIRALIITGADPVFCAGLDLDEARDPSLEEASADLIAHTLLLLAKAPFITIAAVEGAALAGGAGMMAACDVVVAASDVKIGFPEVLRGLVPAQIAPILAKQVGWRALRELFLFGKTIDAVKAQQIGLVNEVVEPGTSLTEALKWAKESLRGAPESIRLTKIVLDDIDPAKVEENLLKTMSIHHLARQSKEAEEGIHAFLEKRKPVWNQRTKSQ